ncbi:MAG: cell wall metabolism sensor histidine kinase WalK, partial [Syntrophobacteraceae bacterium]|nr:cell wall metabolism sensor histidine kinase WalK [Syntrophobacteraceae bacterium]
NHSDRPEIMASMTQEMALLVRFSRTTQKVLIYAARRVPGENSIPAGVLRLAAPFSRVKEPLERLKHSFILFLALVLSASTLLSTIILRRLNRPIKAMIETAEAISVRDYARRIHSTPGHEFHPLTQSINKMAQSIENHVRTISEQKQQLEAIFDAMQEGVMVLDSSGKIRSTNRSFSELTSGVPQVIGRRPLEVIVNLELQRLCDEVVASGEKGMEHRLFQSQIVLDGERTYDVSAVRLPHPQGGMGAVVVLHDITELKRLERVRRDFVANVSHELRTPLTSIKGYTETLLSEVQPGSETMSSFLQVILKNTNHMVKMVEDLLQLARLEKSDQSFKPVSIDARQALLAAWKACGHLAEAKSVRFENDLPEQGIQVSADSDQLVQVFRNLLENAIRHSPPGTALNISCRGDRDKTVFAVRDEGPGIPRQDQQRIFERFYRVEKHRGEHWGGTGLGLAICRNIIRNHGGTIWVQSPSPGETKGTTFFFTLAAVAGEPAEPVESIDSATS